MGNGLLDLLVQPLLQLVLVFRLLTLLLGPFVYMAAAGTFFVVDPITPLVIEDVPQILLTDGGARPCLGGGPEAWLRLGGGLGAFFFSRRCCRS